MQKLKNFFGAGSIFGGVVTLTIAIIGAGVLTTPVSFYYSGIYLSSILYFICALLGYISNMFLVDIFFILLKKEFIILNLFIYLF